MVTNCPRRTVQDATVQMSDKRQPILLRLLARLGQMLCGLHGHDHLLHFDRNRVYLQCASCGYETPGWSVGQRRPRIRLAGDPKRQYLPARVQSFMGRRVA
jgi:hypothetical protein